MVLGLLNTELELSVKHADFAVEHMIICTGLFFSKASVKLLQQRHLDILGMRKWILGTGREAVATFLV